MLKKTVDLTKTDDDSNTLFSERYQQTYHSSFGAVAEAMHVFLQGAAVQQRLQAAQPTRVLEIGFGLGLNCLLSADCANTNKTALHYTSIEHLPVDASELQQLDYARWLEAPELADVLIQSLADSLEAEALDAEALDAEPCVADGPAKHQAISKSNQLPTLISSMLGAYTRVELHIDDASTTTLLEKLKGEHRFDAIYLDAFSPDVNPECWTEAFFHQLSPLLATQGRLATYCVKGSVRRALGAAGFTVIKYPGPTGKREVLFATLTNA